MYPTWIQAGLFDVLEVCCFQGSMFTMIIILSKVAKSEIWFSLVPYNLYIWFIFLLFVINLQTTATGATGTSYMGNMEPQVHRKLRITGTFLGTLNSVNNKPCPHWQSLKLCKSWGQNLWEQSKQGRLGRPPTCELCGQKIWISAS